MRNTKIKTKTEKGITLIALIITIVVLLILAVVAINSIQNDGIISKAQNAADKYNQSVQNEADQLQNYLDYLNGNNGGGQNPVVYAKVSDAKNNETVFTVNTTLQDDNGNLVKVPAGFKIAEDSATAVTGGVVIEDATYTNTIGSQFVWIPTGNIKTSPTDATGTNITLARYTFDVKFTSDNSAIDSSSTGAIVGTYTSATDVLEDPLWTNAGMDIDFVEGTIADIDDQGKGYALNINDFLNSAKPITEGGNGGYYIGRYEARKNSTTNKLTTVGTDNVWNSITQPEATTASQGMYATNSNFTSDLVNSFAWDTAIAFIQAFGDNDYSMQISKNSSLATTGTNNLTDTSQQDVVCNIWDMASNCTEWSSETNSNSKATYTVVYRGGYFVNNPMHVSMRYPDKCTTSSDRCSFRPVLYVGL